MKKHNSFLVFLLLFFGLVAGCLILFQFVPILTDWSVFTINDGIISEATIRNIDIGARKFYYNFRNFIFLIISISIAAIISKYKKDEFVFENAIAQKINKWLLMCLSLIIGLAYVGTGPSFYPDMFEKANPALSIDRIMEFQIPIIEYLSSHMLSEQVTPLLYTLFHPSSGPLEWLSWEFVIPVFNGVIFFILLSRWFNNQLLAFAFLLCFPFAIWIIPKEYLFGFIPLLLIKPNLDRKRIITLSIVLILGFLWKLDTGIAGLTSTILSVLFLSKWTNQKIKPWLVAAICTIALGLMTFAITYLFYPEVLNNFHLARDYFTADQAHGRVVLTDWTEDFKFRFHYAYFPIISCALLGLVMVKKKQDYLSTSLVFSVIFYLTNFQRGVVRHSFTSGTDIYTSSVMYLIIGLAMLILLRRFTTNKFILFTVFMITTSAAILIFKPGNYLHKKSLISQAYLNINSGNLIRHIHPNWIMERDEFITENVLPFKTYLDNHLQKDETFLDLSNHPMLYHYTGRQCPSYFNQFLQNTATSRSQLLTVERLNKEQIPIVLYAYHPQEWLDRTDNVPNALRYHIVHAHIKTNYRPLGMVNNKIIWLHNSEKTSNYLDGLSPIPCIANEEYFGILPKLIASNETTTSSNIVVKDSIGFTYLIRASTVDLQFHESLRIKGNFDEKSYVLKIESDSCINTVKFKAYKNQNEYIIPIDWLPKYPNRIRLDDTNMNNFEFTTLKVRF